MVRVLLFAVELFPRFTSVKFPELPTLSHNQCVFFEYKVILILASGGPLGEGDSPASPVLPKAKNHFGLSSSLLLPP